VTSTDPAVVDAALDPASSSIVASDPGASTTVADASADGPDLDGAEPNASGDCTMTQRAARQGDTGPDVICIQKALIASGALTGTPSGTFDTATFKAIESLQTQKDMFVDGVVGRETALSLGVWPDEASLVVHTPKPAAGAKDLLGYPLSSVAVSGPDAPPLPANSGSGKRLVYSRSGQRVWAVDKNETVVRSWLVSGSKYNNEQPGVHTVYSRSETSTAWNGKAILPHMVRYQKTNIGNIGFHGIPIHVADGTAYMTEDELGTRLSGGCQRQANRDADFTWAFAQIGTTVVVL
jgi:peptidoglycan hydrolase-like protein with peptidoglycan-binding domain